MTPIEWQKRHEAARTAGKWLYATHRAGERGRVIGVSKSGVRVRYGERVEVNHGDDLRTVRAR